MRAVLSGSVDCWGDNSSGELGNGTTSGPDCSGTCNPTPTPVIGVGGSGTLTGVASLVTEASYGPGYCAVQSSGSVDCWGNNTSGDLGNGTTSGPDCSGTCNPTPTPVIGVGGSGTLTGVASLTSDGFGYCAILKSESVDCWGDNSTDQLGNGTSSGPDCSGTCNPTPTPVIGVGGSGTLTGVASLASDGSDAGYCAALTSGSVDCWGSDNLGELGNGTNGGASSDVPVAVPGVTTATSLNGNMLFSYCAVLTSGSVVCWGNNEWGQLGNGSFSLPTEVGAPGPVIGVTTAISVTSLEADGIATFCAVLSSGHIDCWGFDGGLLGNGSVSGPNPNPTPGPVIGVTTATTLTSDGLGDCALLSSGHIDCWGSDGGLLGNGSVSGPDPNPTPGPVVGVTTAISVVNDGNGGYCAVLTSGSVDCWGYNTSGDLGNGSLLGPDPNPTPGPVVGL